MKEAHKYVRSRRQAAQDWTPFIEAPVPEDLLDETGNPRECWLNNRYQVLVYAVKPAAGWPPCLHLSIKLRSREPIRDWRDLQRIKNELSGTESEGLELFPAESRLVDAANQYHMTCFCPGLRVPVGSPERDVNYGDRDDGSQQRALLPHHTADGCKPVGPIWDGIDVEAIKRVFGVGGEDEDEGVETKEADDGEVQT